GNLAAHMGTVIERDTRFPVDEQAQHRVRTAGRVFQLDQLVTQTLDQRFNEGNEPLPQGPRHDRFTPRWRPHLPAKQKWASRPTKNKKPRGGLYSPLLLGGTARVRGRRRRYRPPAPARTL